MARGTYTVKQLRTELSDLPDDALVFIDNREMDQRIDSVLYDPEYEDRVWLYTERL